MRVHPVCLLLIITAATAPCAAQTPEQDVLIVVHRLFDGMRQGDSAMVRSVFDSTVQFISAGNANGVPAPAVRSVDRFVAAVGAPHAQRWDERIWDPDVRLDGGLASVWTRYAFYLGEQFHHCGVDAFGLVRRPEGWKVVYLADTERSDGCWKGPGS